MNQSQESLKFWLEAGLSRRKALLMMGAASLWGACSIKTASGLVVTHDQALDDALKQLHGQEPECKSGLSTHAPMVAEALCALGQPDKALRWVETDDGPVRKLPAASQPIKPDQWRLALGPRPVDRGSNSWEAENARWGDWKEFFHRELSENRWQEVLDLWVGRLAPGMSGAATHGIIRTSHAVRALAARETPERRAELVRGLAYWASSYEELPDNKDHKPSHSDSYAKAIEQVPRYWDLKGKKPQGRNIVESLRGLREIDKFALIRDLAPVIPNAAQAISALTAAFTRVYLTYGTRNDAIAFVHAVTGPCSLRRMAPHIKPETARAALPHAWQTAAAIYSAFARGDAATPRQQEPKKDRAELVAQVIANGDAHVIKFVEVMLSEHMIHPDPVYLAAAEDIIKRF